MTLTADKDALKKARCAVQTSGILALGKLSRIESLRPDWAT